MVNVLAISDLILHVLNFFLCGVESHTTHHVGDGTQRDLSVELTGLSCMFVLRSNLAVVKEVFEIAHHLSVGSALEQVGERIALRLLIKALS